MRPVESQVSVDEGVCKPDPELNLGNLSVTVYIRFIIVPFLCMTFNVMVVFYVLLPRSACDYCYQIYFYLK